MRTLAIASVLLLAPLSAMADCPNNNEQDALAIRAMQSRMMVAALSCGEQSQYNRIMTKHKNSFARSGRMIKAYFQRAYGGGYETQLNRFMTSLANIATQTSLQHDSDEYCNTMRSALRKLLDTRTTDLAYAAHEDRGVSMKGIKGCAWMAQR